MSTRRFPLDPPNVTVAAPGGRQTTLHAETLTARAVVPVEHILASASTPNPYTASAHAVLRGIHDVACNIDSRLAESGRVADAEIWSLTVRIEARVKTWPALPGVTTGWIPMPPDAS